MSKRIFGCEPFWEFDIELHLLQRLLWDNGSWVPLGAAKNIVHLGLYGLDGVPFGICKYIPIHAPIFAWLARTKREQASGICCVWANERCEVGRDDPQTAENGHSWKSLYHHIMDSWDVGQNMLQKWKISLCTEKLDESGWICQMCSEVFA